MAVDPKDIKTGQLDFSVEDRQWLSVAVQMQIKSLERMAAKYPPGSAGYVAHTKDAAYLRQLAEKVRPG